MIVLLYFIAFCAHASSPILGSAVKNYNESCRRRQYLISNEVKFMSNVCNFNEIACSDGSCVSFDSICDGKADCPDGTDETTCGSSSDTFADLVLHRSKRQSTCGSKFEWRCRDGTCISFDGKCDGAVDCPDGSDETFPLCRTTPCQPNWFRCTYGACVDGTSPCNGIKDCADNSDELLPRCRNETDEIMGEYKCLDGTTISAAEHCDGTVNCPDGSDETVRACAAKACPSYLFRCAYGACVDKGADCNGKQECSDGSDESDELCNRNLQPTYTGTTTTTSTTTKAPKRGNCEVPNYPEHGRYVTNEPNAAPGQGYEYLQLNVTCNRGYGVIGPDSVYCLDGTWYGSIPQCIRFCELKKHPSVIYHCLVSRPVVGTKECNAYEPPGAVVRVECNAPNYYSDYSLPNMRCIDGYWNEMVTCLPECGKVTPGGEILVIGGVRAKRGELPWHAGIYDNSYTPYKQICGGSLVSTTVVVSAAHCFWEGDNQLPSSRYAVAVGKLYRPWNNDHDLDAQKSDVANIHIPQRFRGSKTNFQDDIAVVVVAKAFMYETYVRPVCLSFTIFLENQQLVAPNMGKVAGWGLTSENGVESPVLLVTELPYVNIDQCYNLAPEDFKEYITSDKICAGYPNNSSALCKGDSGGGLVFPSKQQAGGQRYYLRGVVSTAPAPSGVQICNAFAVTTFTQISKHEIFINSFL